MNTTDMRHELLNLGGGAHALAIQILENSSDAASLGGNAVVAARFTTSVIMGGAAEVLAVGTAVVIEDDNS